MARPPALFRLTRPSAERSSRPSGADGREEPRAPRDPWTGDTRRILDDSEPPGAAGVECWLTPGGQRRDGAEPTRRSLPGVRIATPRPVVAVGAHRERPVHSATMDRRQRAALQTSDAPRSCGAGRVCRSHPAARPESWSGLVAERSTPAFRWPHSPCQRKLDVPRSARRQTARPPRPRGAPDRLIRFVPALAFGNGKENVRWAFPCWRVSHNGVNSNTAPHLTLPVPGPFQFGDPRRLPGSSCLLPPGGPVYVELTRIVREPAAIPHARAELRYP